MVPDATPVRNKRKDVAAKVIDCTPPPGFPTMCLMMSSTGFFVRIEEGNAIRLVELPGEATLPGAVQAADRLGHRCEHWCDIRGEVAAFPAPIPSGIRRVKAETK